MNRLFHARIVMGQYVALVLLAACMLHGFWYRQIGLAVVFMLLLILCIEKLIHTTYTLTSDGRLVLYRGRFLRTKEIWLQEITSVEQISSMKIGKWAVMHYVLVKYEENRCEAFLPVNEEEFIRILKKRIQEVTNV